MNKTHRIVWSEARQTYVVAHENAASSGKPSSTRKGVVHAVAAALLALGAGQVFAAADICSGSGNKTISGVQTPGDYCRLTQPDSVLVTLGAAITGAGQAMFATYGVSAGAVVNQGEISGTSVGIFIASAAVDSGVTNSGLISGHGGGIKGQNHAIITGGIVNTNSGTIKGMIAGSTTIQAYGISLNTSTINGSITNSGLISASATISGGTSAYAGTANAMGLANATVNGSIINSGTIVSSVIDLGSSNFGASLNPL